ncbi:DoxX family protein [Tsuneonella sp. HG222]
MKIMLSGLARFEDATLFGLRALTGAFLVHEVWDNIASADRMAEFVAFLAQFGFAAPQVMAPLSVWVQFVCGVLLVLGLLTRWAGLLVMVNFVVAVIMVHWAEPFRGWWPALVLVFLGAHFAAAGSGRFGLDALFLRERHER